MGQANLRKYIQPRDKEDRQQISRETITRSFRRDARASRTGRGITMMSSDKALKIEPRAHGGDSKADMSEDEGMVSSHHAKKEKLNFYTKVKSRDF